MRRVRILEAAAMEAIEAAAWYDNERPGLGDEFGRAINAALDLLEDGIVPFVPVPGEAGRAGAMRIMLKRFPYDVIVRDMPNEIVVVALAHHSRRPGYWRDRLRAKR